MRYLIIPLFFVMLAGCTSRTEPTRAHGKPIEEWVAALQSPDAKLRKKAADVMGNVGAMDPAVVPALAGALKDGDRSVREAAALALLKIGPAAKDAAPALEAARQDPDARVRSHAIRALEKVRAAS